MELDLTIGQYKALKQDRVTDQEIADSLFIGMATLQRWKKRNNLKAGRTKESYLELKAQGYKEVQIAMQWGITRSALYLWKRRVVEGRTVK